MNLASQNFIIPIFPSCKLLLKNSGREMIRIAKFANGKKHATDTIRSRWNCCGSFYRFVFLFLNPRKLFSALQFPLKSGPLYAILMERRVLQTDTYTFLAFFVNKLFSGTVFDERKRQNSEEKGKKCKEKFRRTCIVLTPLYAIDEAGKTNCLPGWV